MDQEMKELLKEIRKMDDNDLKEFLEYFRDLSSDKESCGYTIEDMIEISINR